MEDAELQVVWGKQVSQDIFKRWTQGFVFSPDEPLALVQQYGGPCAVLAPVQAFIIQKRLYEKGEGKDLDKEEWRLCTDTLAQDLLISALTHILYQATNNSSSCKIATLKTTPTQSVAMTTASMTTPITSKPEDVSSSGGLKRKHPSPLSEEKCDYKRDPLLGGGEGESGEGESDGLMLLSDVAIAQLIQQTGKGGGVTGSGSGLTPGGGSGSGLTLEALSSALSNVKAINSRKEEEEMIVETPPTDTPTIAQTIMTPVKGSETCTSHNEGSETHTAQGSESCTTDSEGSKTCTVHISNQSSAQTTQNEGPAETPSKLSDSTTILETTPQTTPPHTILPLDSESFHNDIKICDCSDMNETVKCLKEHYNDLTGPFGVLLFLYSVVLTKGVEQLMEESEENEQPLIDPLHGHGSQNLINMLLVGRCVTNVFDLDKDLGGIKLRGIPRQSTVGFLTILEALRYCEVGSYLKSPQYPVWVIGSETHLTVLFSIEIGLTTDEDAQTVARREFEQFSYNGETGLMATSMLGELLKRLDLETDRDYVEYMKSKLDQESTGVILLGDFLAEFYPYPQMEFDKPKAFIVYHYNGLLHNREEKIKLARGQAAVLGEEGSTNTEVSLSNCLHTKWPALVIHWDDQNEPKII